MSGACTPVIPALRGEEGIKTYQKLKVALNYEFKASLGYLRLHPKKKNNPTGTQVPFLLRWENQDQQLQMPTLSIQYPVEYPGHLTREGRACAAVTPSS